MFPNRQPYTELHQPKPQNQEQETTYSSPIGAFVHIAIVSLSIRFIMSPNSRLACAGSVYGSANGSCGGNHVSGAGVGANALGSIGAGPSVPVALPI